MISKAEAVEVLELAVAEMRKLGTELKLEIAVEPVVEAWLARAERAARINGLAALVQLEAAGLEAERWAADIGSTYSSDPRVTSTSELLRELLAEAGVRTKQPEPAPRADSDGAF